MIAKQKAKMQVFEPMRKQDLGQVKAEQSVRKAHSAGVAGIAGVFRSWRRFLEFLRLSAVFAVFRVIPQNPANIRMCQGGHCDEFAD